ncbi:zinc finger family protein [Salix suchowensis]|nr:zinc finger family protein [Salix suchowensis]
MGVSYLAISAVCTVLSFSVLTEVSLDILRSDGLTGENLTNLGNANRAVELLFESYATIALVMNFVFNVFLLLNLCLKTIFFGELYPSETQKLVERLINYAIYKGTLLPLVIPPTISQTGLWSVWLTVLCFLKMFQALARDRLERLNASPSATPWTYFRAYSALLLVLSADFFWIQMCYVIYRSTGSSMFLLLFFEPFSIAFETMQAMLVHGFQLLEIWLHHSTGNSANCQRFKFFDAIRAGSLLEWKGILIRNLGFSLDIAAMLMALGHYVHIWWVRGVALHLVDAILFLNIRALLSAIIKRIKGFIKLRIAFNALHAALPDATSEELRAYDDECAICREPMAKAKRLHCSHLFHLACLRSWLDQGLNEIYSCPICRTNTLTREVLTDEQLAHQINEGFDRQNTPGRALLAGAFPTPIRNSTESSPWRSTGLDSIWLPTWSSQGADRAGPSTDMRSVGLGRVQMMMRHLASVGETYAQTALEDAAWSLWPTSPSQATPSASSTPSAAGGRHPGGLHMRTASHPTNDYVANILAMAETVREVLPLVPDELILQDLQRTNSATVTVNNLLHM